jgi:hypothetical protein
MWVSEKVTVARSAIDGNGLHATDDLGAGTVVIRLAGRLVSSAEVTEILAAAPAGEEPTVDTITMFEDRHLVLPSGTVVDFGNHSCDPTLWHVGSLTRREGVHGECGCSSRAVAVVQNDGAEQAGQDRAAQSETFGATPDCLQPASVSTDTFHVCSRKQMRERFQTKLDRKERDELGGWRVMKRIRPRSRVELVTLGVLGR